MSDFDIGVDESLCLTIDIQERFASAIPAIAPDAECGRAAATLLRGCTLLEVPVVISEQVPDKLGATLPHLREAAPTATVHAKQAFSCGDDPHLRDAIASAERQHLIVCGIEAHVCVLATVDDLLRRGYRVTVACDAVASRAAANIDHAIATMRQLGALCVPVESILFRLQREAGVGCFKEISKLVR